MAGSSLATAAAPKHKSLTAATPPNGPELPDADTPEHRDAKAAVPRGQAREHLATVKAIAARA